MAWVKERTTDDGDKRFVACYRDPEGRQRSAGTYSSRRAASIYWKRVSRASSLSWGRLGILGLSPELRSGV